MNDDEEGPPAPYQGVALAVTNQDDVEVTSDGRGSGAMTRRATNTLNVDVRQSPLPSPEDMAAYEKGCPGMGMAIIQLARTEQSNRHERDMVTRKSDAKVKERGQVAGSVLIVSMLASGVFLLTHGVPIAGVITLVSTGLTAIASAAKNRKPAKPSAPAPAPPPPPAPQPEQSTELAKRS